MTSYVALLRAVNVGARTFIASGNLLFHSDGEEAQLKRELERAIEHHMGKRVEVMLRSADELANVVAGNPLATEPGNRVVAIFLEDAPPAQAIASAKNIADERLAPGSREIYVHFPSGQGQSKLKFDARSIGTARNMNTTAKLAELAREKK